MHLLQTLIHPRDLVHLVVSFSGLWVYVALFAIVFSETGLLAGFFLPGDSLLFTLGVVCGSGELNVVTVIAVLIAAAIIGDTTGFFLGRTAGPRIFSRPKSRFFNPRHLEDTQAFYAKYGGKTLIYARFVPIIRTFAPFVAGVACMPYAKFIVYSICGGMGWVIFMTLLGYSLGHVAVVQQYFDQVVILIIVISLLPAAMQVFKNRRGVAAS
jgi:membrane-associated protein